MSTPRISNALNHIDDELIAGAADNAVAKRKILWGKWGTLAACFALVAVMGIGLIQGGVFGGRTDVATLNSTDKIIFVKAKSSFSPALHDLDVVTKPLTKEEAATLFGDLPVTASAAFSNDNAKKLLGFDGKIENIRMIISTSDVVLLDEIIFGAEETCEINGTSISAGYFVTDANSRGEQTAIYYATFEIGECKIHLENAGAKENSENTKNELAETIQKLLENGELNLTSYINAQDSTAAN